MLDQNQQELLENALEQDDRASTKHCSSPSPGRTSNPHCKLLIGLLGDGGDGDGQADDHGDGDGDGDEVVSFC